MLIVSRNEFAMNKLIEQKTRCIVSRYDGRALRVPHNVNSTRLLDLGWRGSLS